MASMQLQPEFSEFLKLLNANGVEYLLIGGYAVGYYGYPRYTGDMDIWVRADAANAERVVLALKEFGFDVPGLSPDLFTEPGKMARMGNAPVRIEILTVLSGVEFDECMKAAQTVVIEGIRVPMISIDHLLTNKRASGRHKDLEDVAHLERLERRKKP